ncbi:MAG: DUF167 domain-containing protein [Anaerolineales bacterium]
MADRKFRLHDGKRGAALAVRVTPRASRNEITEIQSDGTVKIRLTAPPVDGEANELLVAFLSDVLGIAKSNIDIVAGLSGRDKLISVTDMDKDEVHSRLVAYLE